MRILVTASRILVGSLFIVSGLIKANDTLGFSYKLVEYFEPDVLNLPFMIPFALPLAALLCIAEVVLGVATLLGGKMKLTSWSLLLMIVFFTFLTFYSAYFDKVTDCGCFGDAIKLTPWQSFTKDVVLLVFVLIIFVKRKDLSFNSLVEDRIILPIAAICVALFSVLLLSWNFPWVFTVLILGTSLLIKAFVKSKQLEWILAAWITVTSGYFCYHTYAHLPLRDFRPYAVGKNLLDGMKTAEELGLKPPKYESMFVLKNNETGAEERMLSSLYLKVYSDSIDTNKDGVKDQAKYTYVSADEKPIKIEDGYEPPIHDFSILDENGEDITFSVLDDPGYTLFVVAYDISKSAVAPQKELNTLYNACVKNNVKVMGLTASSAEEVQTFKHEHQSLIDYFQMDAIVLKTVIRSNPGIVLLKKGTVLGQWHHNDLPAFEEIQSLMK
ncbi:MAG TPA: DoxX family protein [Luteibaculaceae bacterium]|nr:DoxX family protein [Luteibaculaceae bacterium]